MPVSETLEAVQTVSVGLTTGQVIALFTLFAIVACLIVLLCIWILYRMMEPQRVEIAMFKEVTERQFQFLKDSFIDIRADVKEMTRTIQTNAEKSMTREATRSLMLTCIKDHALQCSMYKPKGMATIVASPEACYESCYEAGNNSMESVDIRFSIPADK